MAIKRKYFTFCVIIVFSCVIKNEITFKINGTYFTIYGTFKTGLGDRHLLYLGARRLVVFGGGHWPVFPTGGGLGHLRHTRTESCASALRMAFYPKGTSGVGGRGSACLTLPAGKASVPAMATLQGRSS